MNRILVPSYALRESDYAYVILHDRAAARFANGRPMTSHHFISWDIYPPFYSNISRSHQHCSSKITKMFFNKICHFNSHLREITLISVTKKLRFKFGKISVRKENKTHKQAQWPIF
jgi:hypothetical protein